MDRTVGRVCDAEKRYVTEHPAGMAGYPVSSSAQATTDLARLHGKLITLTERLLDSNNAVEASLGRMLGGVPQRGEAQPSTTAPQRSGSLGAIEDTLELLEIRLGYLSHLSDVLGRVG